MRQAGRGRIVALALSAVLALVLGAGGALANDTVVADADAAAGIQSSIAVSVASAASINLPVTFSISYSNGGGKHLAGGSTVTFADSGSHLPAGGSAGSAALTVPAGWSSSSAPLTGTAHVTFTAPTTAGSYSYTAAWTASGYSCTGSGECLNGRSQSISITVTVKAPADTQPPSTPANLHTTLVASGEVDLAWSASTDNVGVTGYRLYRNGVLLASPTGTSFADKTVAPSTAYSYTVSALDAAGNESAQSGPLAVTTPAATDTQPPSTPANLHTTLVASGEVDLAWSASTDNVGVTGYRLYRNGVLLASPTGTSFADKTVAPSTAYSYTVSALDAAGNESAQSGPLAVTTPAATDTQPPSTPANLHTTLVASGEVDLAWSASTDNVGVTGYRLYRNGVLLASPTGTSFADKTVAPSTAYSYTVSALDAAGNESAQSGPLAVTTPAATDTQPPSTPANLHTTLVASGEVDLAWSASTDNVGVTGYRLYRNGVLLASPTGTSFADKTVAPSTAYSYTVSALDAAGNESAQSGPLAVTTPAATDTQPPSTPANLHTTLVASGEVDLAWSASTDNVGVTGYRLYRNGVLLASPTGTSFADKTVAPSTAYSYTVSALDAAGNESAQSGPLAVTTPAATDTQPPSTPANLHTTLVASGEVDLAWSASTDNVGVTGYRLYRNGVLLASPTGTSFADKTVAPSTAYSYTVSALDAAGNESAQSGPLAVTTPAATGTSTTLTNSAEGGSDGVALIPGVTGNTGGGSGNYFDWVAPNAGGTIAFSAAAAAHGSLGIEFAQGATPGNSTVAWVGRFPTSPQQIAGSFYLSYLNNSGNNVKLATFYTSDGWELYGLYLAGNNKIGIVDANAVLHTTSAGSPLVAGHTYRIAFSGGIGLTGQTVTATVYDGDTQTVVCSVTATNISTLNAGSTGIPFQIAYFGPAANTPANSVWRYDDIQLTASTSG